MEKLVHRLGQDQVFSLTTSLKLMEMEIAPVESVQQHQSGQLQAAALPGLGKLRRPKQTTLDYTSHVARETSLCQNEHCMCFFCGAKKDQDIKIDQVISICITFMYFDGHDITNISPVSVSLLPTSVHLKLSSRTKIKE